MDSYPDVLEHESSPKRPKLDLGNVLVPEMCSGDDFPAFSTFSGYPIDHNEGASADCDSGYEASTMESIPTSSHQTSPQTDSDDIQENLSEILLTPSYNIDRDQADTSQDSIEDDNASTVSELSGLSDLSGQDWKPMAGSMIWIQKQMQNGVNPRSLLSELGVDLDQVPQYVDEVTLWKLLINMLAEPPRRNKLRHINTLDDVVRLVKGAQNIIILTGAGVSVSCGIPDFRSRDGIYSRLAIDFPNLPDPQAMFDISYFSQDPRPFFKFARDIYPGKFQPSPCHKFIKMLEKHGKLLRNYTQNIDTLEKVANIKKVIECHGSFATATCTKCGNKVEADAIRDLVLTQKIPLCIICHNGKESIDPNNDENDEIDYRELVSAGIMKPDIVFFGEGLPDTFHDAMSEDKSKCDLLLVIGSSLKVRPVALIPSSLPPNVPQILINREPLPHCHFDVELLGDCDVIINHLCHLFGGSWKEGIYDDRLLEEVHHLLPLENDSDKCKEETEPSSSSCNTNNNNNNNDKLILNINNDDDDDNNENEKDIILCTCKCKDDLSTKLSSSSSLNNYIESTNRCKCNLNNNKKKKSIINYCKTDDDYNNVNSIDIKSIKERHMSIDSARDSGIGDNSNFTDLETKFDDNYNDDDDDDVNNDENPKSSTDLRGYWEPKIKKSLADRLPSQSYYLIQPSRYIFPGAELYYDPDDKFDDRLSSNDSSSSPISTTSDDSESCF